MAANYEKSLESIKAKNGGVLPSDLYLQTNAQLSQILYDLTGDIKHKCRPASKETLVKRIEKLTKKSISSSSSSVGSKRKLEDIEDNGKGLFYHYIKFISLY